MCAWGASQGGPVMTHTSPLTRLLPANAAIMLAVTLVTSPMASFAS